jgi:hypothetical protein
LGESFGCPQVLVEFGGGPGVLSSGGPPGGPLARGVSLGDPVGWGGRHKGNPQGNPMSPAREVTPLAEATFTGIPTSTLSLDDGEINFADGLDNAAGSSQINTPQNFPMDLDGLFDDDINPSRVEDANTHVLVPSDSDHCVAESEVAGYSVAFTP